jgi:hypothetical protein
MAKVYVIGESGQTVPMRQIHCKDEDRELQQILEKNLDLLPGDQIDPENPRKWLLIKREMPVPDPNTGGDRWSVDFLLADQDAIPTFVECKRFKDTRSRREVVGQMLEYSANGHYYWDKELLRDLAEKTAKTRGTDLENTLASVGVNPSEVDAFFSRMQENLREGQVRIVFFLEDSPMELRSVVDFLNKQMERSEVLLVEARQFAKDGMSIVVPTLFGFTEEARQAKRRVNVETKAARKKWNEEMFFVEAERSLPSATVAVIRNIFDKCVDAGFQISFGSGTRIGSFLLRYDTICDEVFLAIFTNGALEVRFDKIGGSPSADSFREGLKRLVEIELGQTLPSNYPNIWCQLRLARWEGRAAQLPDLLRKVVAAVEQNDKQ